MAILLTIVFIAGIGLLIYMLREAFSDRVLRQTISLPELPESFGGLTVFFISDIHRRVVSGRIVEDIAGKADLIIIGGDLTEKGVPLERVKENLIKLREAAPVYFIWGNNDYEIAEETLSSLLKECGAVELKNTHVSFIKGDEVFALIGLDDLAYRRPALSSILSGISPNAHRILLCHNPSIIREVKEDHRIALTLSGHTHGGQIRIFGIGPYELGSLRQLPQTIHLISNGYGTTSLPLRLGAKAETHLLTIKGVGR